ncbi:hypothetical protein SFRURICE_010931 [Spodoptera frugiperda]|nr:hypothetical protein SFRURICE_010931 [Spodoptera frugiperda]
MLFLLTSPDYFNIWLNLELLVPFVIDCWVDNLKLEYDNVTRTTKGPRGVDIRIPGWGNPEPVEWLDPSHQSTGAYFNTIADSLVKLGYERNVSILGAPYDFRKAPNENGKFFTDLKTMVENTYMANNKSSVTLLVHSMGGLMAMHFLRLQPQAWKDQYIRRLISLSTPWGGSMKAVKRVVGCGDDALGSGPECEGEHKMRRRSQITVLGVALLAWLLPSPLFWKPAEVLVQTDKYNYTVNDFQRLFTLFNIAASLAEWLQVDMELPDAWEMRKDTEKYTKDFSAPGVEVHCIYGLVYKPGTWLDGYPTLAMGDGDGTVNLRSLNACEHWRKRRFRNGNTVKSLALPDAEHLKILHDKRVLDYIQLVMKN